MNRTTKKWLFMKLSSIILIPLMFWLIINLVSIYDKDYQDIENDMRENYIGRWENR